MKPLLHQLWLYCIAIATTSGMIAVNPVLASQRFEDTSATLQPSLVTQTPSADARLAEAYRLLEQGVQQHETSQFQEALQSLEQALTIYQEVGDRNREAITTTALGITYNSLSRYQEAIASYQQALPIFQQVGNRNGEALALMNLGIAYGSLSQYQEAIAYFQQVLPIFQEVGDRSSEAAALTNLGVAHSSLNQYQEAIAYHQQALSIFQQVGDRSSEATALTNLGVAHRSLSQYQEAIAYHQQALSIFQQVGNRNGEAGVLVGMGIAYRSLSQYQEAIAYYEQALPIYQEVGNRNGEAEALVSMGNAYYSLSQYSEAIAYYQQTLPIFHEVGNRNNEAIALNNLGNAYNSLNQYQEAIAYYQRALPIYQEVSDRNGEAQALNNLGLAYSSLSQHPEAVAYYEQALLIFQQVSDRNGEALALNNLGVAYRSLSQYSEAIVYFQQALPIFEQVGDRENEGLVLANVGKVLEVQGQAELAIVFLKQSVNVRESIRDGIRALDSTLQESYTESVERDYRRLADLLLQQGRVMEAQEVLDLLKLQELDDYLQNVQGNEQTAQGVYTWEFEDQILAEFEAAVQQGQDFEAFVDSTAVTAHVAALQRIAREQRIPEALLTKLQDNLRQLDRPAALLYPLILEDRLEVVVILPNAPPLRHTVAVTQSELEATIQSFRQYLTQRTSRQMAPAQQLYDWLIRPIASDLQQAGVETLLYAADGQLRYIPLAALHDGEQWLVQQFTINQITAASLTNFAASPESNLRVLAGAYSDRQLTYEFAIGERQFSFNGLEYAGVEVEAIASSIPQTTTFFDRNFSRSAVEPQLGNYTVVHFATHAEFVSGVPDESFILFGNGDRLSLRELSGLSLPEVDLVVLSACRTAVSGALGNGEEILGFGYQIQQTGADAAIASLWYVNDGGTQVLMDAFYTALNNGYSKAEALQRAQIALITSDQSMVEGERGATVDIIDTRTGQPLSQSNDLAHPYYWAPFILIGNGL